MPTYPEKFLPPQHNHITRDIKPFGECPGCDANYKEQMQKNRIKKLLTTCTTCTRARGSSPGASCRTPWHHTAVPRNHGGVGEPPA